LRNRSIFVLVPPVPAEIAEPIVDLLNRGVSTAGIAAREADGKAKSPGNGESFGDIVGFQ
jgi:hypothetical protein